MLLWAVSANGNTSGLQPEIESSILSRSTKFLALLVKWHNTCFVIRYWQFDSVTGHQCFLGVVKWYHSWFGAMWRGFDSLHRDQYVAEYGSGHPLGLISQESGVRIPPLQPIW